ncbi:MAG: hypothetical protein WAQ33_02745 [Gaiellaceae bacterium]
MKAADATAVLHLVGVSSSTSSNDSGNSGSSGERSSSKEKGNDNKKENDDNGKDDEYKPGKGCGDKNHVHAREDECKKLK